MEASRLFIVINFKDLLFVSRRKFIIRAHYFKGYATMKKIQ